MTSSIILLTCLVAASSAFLIDGTAAPADMLELTYFDVAGRGEISRLLFNAAKKPFKDIRVDFASWAAMKPTTPYGHLPLLNVSGVIYTQSIAIQNYVAKVTGFYPQSALDQLMCDQICMSRDDLLVASIGIQSASDPAAANVTFAQKTLPQYLGNWNSYVANNPAKSGFVVGSKLTVGDICIFESSRLILTTFPTALDNFPMLKALNAKVAAADGISQYLAKLYPQSV